MIKIESNYLDNDLFFNIQKLISREDFLWSVQNINISVLTHYLVKEQGKVISFFTTDILSTILQKIDAKVVLEATVKLYTKAETITEYKEPSEFLKGKNYKTFLLFFNSCDGYFYITGLEKIYPKENQAIFIEAPLQFFNTNTTTGKNRLVLAVHYN